MTSEKPVSFQVSGLNLYGIAHIPDPLDPRRPAVVFVAAGETCRSSNFYTRLARAVCRDGFLVLRFDPRGIGDSDGGFDCKLLAEVHREIEDGALVDDVRGAMSWIEGLHGIHEFVLLGLCGGAISAVHVAARDPRVVGIIPIGLTSKYSSPSRPLLRRGPLKHFAVKEFLARSERTQFLLGIVKKAHALRSRFFRRDGNRNAGLLRNLSTVGTIRKGLYIFAGREERVEIPRSPVAETIVIEGADHNFTNPGCYEAIEGGVRNWLRKL
jgi:pimeloyl-ACP methyl ester carboxylesterase